MEYRVSSFMGPSDTMKDLIAKLTEEVTANIRAGATLVGGLSICSPYDDWVCVSQAFTIQNLSQTPP